MSNDKPKSKSEILSELDRLKELLEQDRFDSDDDDIPLLDEVVEVADEDIPVLEEIATTFDSKAGQTPPPPSGGKVPTEQELKKLVDMLVGHQMRKIRPMVQEEVVRLILERYPNLK
jgi:hypothetical protein